MADMKQPTFVTVDGLRPLAKNVNVTVQVIETKTVVDRAARGPKGAALKVSECLVGDSTGVIIFSARNEQVDVAQKGAYVTLRNAKVDMYRGSMRLAVDQFGKVEAAEGQSFKPKADNNLSLVEYELVPIGDAPKAAA